MNVVIGLDRLVAEGFARLRGKRIGLLCNQATVTRDYRHVIDLMLPLHREGFLDLHAVFGPEHGLYGHTQDNMIEWEGEPDARTGLHIHSLYGTHREPTDQMLAGVELLVVDIPDVGSRYYTFIWTMALCMKACERLGIPVLVLDRPNPINGVTVEGTVLEAEYASFVGLHPIPTRHGLTAGEVAVFVKERHYPDVELEVLEVQGWSRSAYLDETDAPWAMPSPNMPTVDTAVVYPGGCLLEATNMSEGRGTTRPFEMFGAPYLDGWRFADALNGMRLAGVYFRPLQFEPTFNKHARTLCEGAFLHVSDRNVFEPVLAYVAIMQAARQQAGDAFEWKAPPYEYEYDKWPIDILAGNSWLRTAVDEGTNLSIIRERFTEECQAFLPVLRSFHRY